MARRFRKKLAYFQPEHLHILEAAEIGKELGTGLHDFAGRRGGDRFDEFGSLCCRGRWAEHS